MLGEWFDDDIYTNQTYIILKNFAFDWFNQNSFGNVP
jgi:hypothetical protein